MDQVVSGETIDRNLWARSMPREHGFEALRVEGELPVALHGLCVRNGPGLFEAQGSAYDHPFEGDGALCGVRFEGGKAWGAHRLVQSRGLIEERAAGRALYGSATWRPRRAYNLLRGKRKNAANTSVVSWQGRLLALFEGGKPTEVDARSLDTIGEVDLGGVIANNFSAHPHRVAARQATYNFGSVFGRKSGLDLFELPDEGPARLLGHVPLEAPLMVHDFIATERHLVFLLSPTEINVAKAFLGTSFSELVQWKPTRGTEVVIVPIDEPTRITRYHVASFFQWHFANAFERGDEIVVDLIHRDTFASFGELKRQQLRADGQLFRVTVSPRTRSVKRECVWDTACEFPRIDPRLEGSVYRHAWVTVQRGDEHGLGHVDLESGRARSFGLSTWERPSEPVFVPRAPGCAEDDGWLLSVVLDAKTDTSHLAVYDTRTFDDGPVARAHFGHPVPVTFHGTWVPNGRALD